jgi:glycosyltransferase involved in cell wall biosynthesis
VVVEKSLPKPHVYMTISTFHPVIGGTQYQAQRLSRALAAQGWPVHVLTRQHSYAHPAGLPPHDVVDGIHVTRVCSRGKPKFGSLLFVLGGLWYLFRSGRRGIYHAHDEGAASWLAVLARRLFGGRCMIKLRTGSHVYKARLSSWSTRWRLLTLLRLADRIVAVNSEVEHMLHGLGLPPEQIVRVPNGVETDQFHPALTGEKAKAYQRLRLPPRKTIFLSVGRLAPYKGVDVLLQAWALLPAHIRLQAHLVVVGDGPRREELDQMIRASGIEGSVSMVGMQQAVRDYYWAADVFVLPSDTEGLSNALLEAMACGLPTIASKVGGALDIVEMNKCGVLFEPGHVAQLADGITEMLARRDGWLDMGRCARQTVKAYADFATVVERYQDTYRDLERQIVEGH